MERELMEKVSAYVSRAGYYLDEKRFDMAYNAYMDALYTIGAYLIYRDTCVLLPGGQLVGMLRSRYPEVYEVIVRYEGVADFSEAAVAALREDVEKLRGRVTLSNPGG